ncbi:MAG: hypothetical protein QOE16_655 [Microbacteriaceae bacterium]|nr:hypothetical protein [Microbacteriaceae bacterium]
MSTRDMGKRRSRAVTATLAGFAVIGSGAAGVAAWLGTSAQASTGSSSLTSRVPMTTQAPTTTQDSPVLPNQGGEPAATSSGS